MTILGQRYTFLPYARQGLNNLANSTSPSPSGRPVVPVNVGLRVDSESVVDVQVSAELQGPGDITSFNPQLVIRTVPEPGDTTFEPNLLACIEFYDEDLPWRYSPTSVLANDKLAPWLFLLVLADGEYNYREGMQGQLPRLTVNRAAVFPLVDSLWAWAHVHVNKDLTNGSPLFHPSTGLPVSDQGNPLNLANKRAVSEQFLNGELPNNPDAAFSRLISPRKLLPNTRYRAFLIPAYEAGRRAGVGQSFTGMPSVPKAAWDPSLGDPVTKEYPVYYNWSFKTGREETFQYLVRQLRPRDVATEVGGMPIDIQEPGFGVRYLNPTTNTIPDGGVVRLQGVLKPARSIPLTFGSKPQAALHFSTELAQLLNYQEDRKSSTGVTTNPYSPLSPNSNALRTSTQTSGENRGIPGAAVDPVIVPPIYGRWHAGITKVKESPANNAWNNWIHKLNLNPTYRAMAGIGSQIIRNNQDKYVRQCFEQLGDILLVNSKLNLLRSSMATTVEMRYHHLPFVTSSTNSPERMSESFREQELHDFGLHLFSPLLRRLRTPSGKSALVEVRESRLSTSLLEPAFRRITRPYGKVMKNVVQEFAPDFSTILTEFNSGKVVGAPPVSPLSPKIVALANFTEIETILNFAKDIIAEEIANGNEFGEQMPDPWVETIVNNEDLLLALDTVPQAFPILEAPVKRPVDLQALKQIALEATQPEPVFLKRAESMVNFVYKGRLAPKEVDDDGGTSRVNGSSDGSGSSNRIRFDSLKPLVAPAPVIDEPMYEALRNFNKELFLPGVERIRHNTITVLEVHQEAIEAFMVGLNYELGQELLWRGFPTDQRGTFFRQFWDPKDTLDGTTIEETRDIKHITDWHTNSVFTKLGENTPENALLRDNQLVLVIKGDLLKKFPNVVIFAQKAKWENGKRILDILPPLKFPIYRGELGADIVALRFDLTSPQAIGEGGDAGWFFCLQERPGEVRFGLDLPKSNSGINSWSDLHWGMALDSSGENLSANLNLTAPIEDNFSALQNGAHMAYATFYLPTKVALHAKEMIFVSSGNPVATNPDGGQ